MAKEPSRTLVISSQVVGDFAQVLAAAVLTPSVGAGQAAAYAMTIGPLAEQSVLAVGKFYADYVSRSGRLIEETVKASERPVEELVEVASSDEPHRALTIQATQAAISAIDEAHLRTIAAAFAEGLYATDAAVVDEARIVLESLAQVSGPHIRLLGVLSQTRRHRFEDGDEVDSENWYKEHILEADAGLGNTVEALTAKLVSLGIAVDRSVGYPGYQPSWALTQFGKACVRQLHRANRRA
jgi:hypothetical protein